MNRTIISEIVRKDLCIGCGMCAALCPKKLLEMRWDHRQELVPVEVSHCEKTCGMCLKVCPFAGPNDNEDVIGKRLYGTAPKMKRTDDAGYYQSSYVGYSNDVHRARGASGGMATWLLEKMLREGVVDHVICVVPDSDPNRLFRFKAIDTPEGVREGAGSVYCQVEMSGAIRHILDNPGKYAITGLPCAIKAIRLAQKNNEKLEEKIKITIGLVCGQTKNMSFTQYIGTLAGVQGQMRGVK
ncbi:MAG TPA: coenzyme F420 hydrogenase/dehydrogenase beta subunit N-terminal domain-containing protein, partial [Methanocella sp.]|nr:coenzyme F420 hydrogenase/dehydrogenase beta subunit N-terminal domain-containing protein [Methanocella sp.]